MSSISDAMKAARKRRGYSVRRLSAVSGVSHPAIYEYESGRHEPGIFNLVRLADALEISIDEYIGRSRTLETRKETYCASVQADAGQSAEQR